MSREVFRDITTQSRQHHYSGQSRIQPGGHAPPRWWPGNFFRQYINIITKPTAYDGL